MTVLAHLGGARESIEQSPAQDWGGRRCADLNTMAIECEATPGTFVPSRLAGLPDDAFEHDGFWRFQWNTTSVPNGGYTLHSVAYDSVGHHTESAGVDVTVSN